MTTMQFSLFDDEPMVAVTAKGKRVTAKLKPTTSTTQTTATPAATPAAASATTKATTKTTTPATRPSTPARPAAQQQDVPLGPEAQLAVSRLGPLQPVVRVALLEMLAVAAVQEAQSQRALLPVEAYPYPVTLNVEMLSNAVQGVLDSPALMQAIALNVLFASVDEPIPEPSKEYLDYLAAEEARKLAQANKPATATATTASTPASSPQTSSQPADQFGTAGSLLAWPASIPAYGKSFKDGKARPITPLVLLVGSRDKSYSLPKLALAGVQYATSQQIRVKFFDSAASERGIMQDGCYCVPTPAHLTKVVERYGVFQKALTHLATTLTTIGTYAQRLREACDIEDGKTAPTSAQIAKLAKSNAGLERLCDQVILAPEPERRAWGFNEPFKLPEVSRGPIFRHTPVSYQKYQGSATIAQHDVFPCVDDATWERVQTAHAAVVAAHKEWLALLAELGTYKVAVNEKRYDEVEAMAAQSSVGATPTTAVFTDTAAESSDAPSEPEASGDEQAADGDTGDDDTAADDANVPAIVDSFEFEELEAVGTEE